jgi:thiol:disulfide interchange protein DsbD
VVIYSIILIIAAATGHTDPFRPFSKHAPSSLTFQPIKNLNDLSRTLALAKLQHKPVLVDFYADWCISCKQMESATFTDPKIQTAMAKFILLRADITNNSMADKLLMQKYRVIAPPTLLFFNSEGEEITNTRVIGEKSAIELLPILEQASANIAPP